jgi:ABC-2 type transport system ATP-binding protein
VLRFSLPSGVHVADLPVLSGEIRETHRRVECLSTDPTRDLHALTGWALQRGSGLLDLEVHRPSLEDVYLELVGRASA